MVIVAQLVRALDCGSRGRRFEPGLSPTELKADSKGSSLFFCSFSWKKDEKVDGCNSIVDTCFWRNRYYEDKSRIWRKNKRGAAGTY